MCNRARPASANANLMQLRCGINSQITIRGRGGRAFPSAFRCETAARNTWKTPVKPSRTFELDSRRISTHPPTLRHPGLGDLRSRLCRGNAVQLRDLLFQFYGGRRRKERGRGTMKKFKEKTVPVETGRN